MSWRYNEKRGRTEILDWDDQVIFKIHDESGEMTDRHGHSMRPGSAALQSHVESYERQLRVLSHAIGINGEHITKYRADGGTILRLIDNGKEYWWDVCEQTAPTVGGAA